MNLKAFTTTFLVTTMLGGTACLIPSSAWAKGGGGHGGSHGGSVSVHGYTRSNGTYVAPYTRSAPGGGSGYSGSNGGSNSTSTTSNTFQDALDSAMSAATLTQSAVSKDDWELVSSKWQDAINLLKEMPVSSPNYAETRVKIQEYGKNLNYARQQLDLPSLTQLEEVTPQNTLNDKSQQNGEILTDNSVSLPLVTAPASSPLLNTFTEKASSPASPQATTAAPVSQPPQVVPISSTEDSNHSGRTLILTVLAVIVVTVFSKAKLLPKAINPGRTNPKQEISNSNFWLNLFSRVLSSYVQKKHPLTEVERLKENRLRQKEERLRTEQRLKEERLKQQRLKEEQRHKPTQRQATSNFWGTGANETKVTWGSWGTGDNKVIVKGYQRKDGTSVKGYKRSKH